VSLATADWPAIAADLDASGCAVTPGCSPRRRAATWPDTLDEWLRTCHDGGQSKSSQILLRHGPGDRNALHRDLFGDLVFHDA
jgi:hypothetical protein